MTLRFGLIGHGYAGRTFHAPLIRAVPGLALAVVASRDAAAVRSAWPEAAVVDTPQALIAHPEVDVVVVASPNRTHHALARAALAAGRHVVVDKPFTLTLAEAADLERFAREQGRVLSVFHNRRWDGDFLTLRSLDAAGAIGRIVQFESHIDRWRPQVRARWRESAEPGAGLWYDLGPHLVDQAVQLLGWPSAITLDIATMRDGALSDDWFHARLDFPAAGSNARDGARAILHASMLAASSSLRYTVHGTRGSFVKQGMDRQEDALKAGALPLWPHRDDWGRDDGPATLSVADDEATPDVLATRPCPLLPGRYADYYAALRDAIEHGAPNPVPPHEACGVMALLEAGLASARERRSVPTPP